MRWLSNLLRSQQRAKLAETLPQAFIPAQASGLEARIPAQRNRRATAA